MVARRAALVWVVVGGRVWVVVRAGVPPVVGGEGGGGSDGQRKCISWRGRLPCSSHLPTDLRFLLPRLVLSNQVKRIVNGRTHYYRIRSLALIIIKKIIWET